MLHTIRYKKIIVPKIPPEGAGSTVSSRSKIARSIIYLMHAFQLISTCKIYFNFKKGDVEYSAIG